MRTCAAVAFGAKRPLEIVELDPEGPKAFEVRVEIKATGVRHTDVYLGRPGQRGPGPLGARP